MFARGVSARTVWLVTLGQAVTLALAAALLMAGAEPALNPQTDLNTLVSLAAIKPMVLLVWLAALVSLASLRWQRLAQHAWFTLMAATGLAGGIALVIPYESAHVLASGNWGLSNLYQVSVLTIAVTGTLALGFDRAAAGNRLLPFITPLLAAAAAFTAWLAHIGMALPAELVPALQNSILPFHVIANFIGYGCFAIGAAAAVALLVRARADKLGRPSRLPPVNALEAIGHRAVSIGFPVFTLAILLGCLWAYQAWGGYWSWDPKETWALVVWLVYAAYLHTRLTRKPGPVVLAWWLLAGFAATLVCYLGVNMFLSGLHSYGSLAV